jgi:type III secretion protein L
MRTLRLHIVKGNPPSPTEGGRTTRLVSARRAAAATEAAALVDSAKLEAARIVAAARSEAGAIRSAAHDAGATEGERAWTEAAAALAERRAEAISGLERDCVLLSIEIARRIVGDVVAIDPSSVAEIAARACARLRRDAALRLWVAPCHAGRVEHIAARLGRDGSVELELDPSLDHASCIAECAGVRVDARVSVQLATIRRRLLGEANDMEGA